MEKNIILVVDDDKENRQILAKNLENTYKVVQASNAQDALKMIGTHFKSLALIFLDVRMPKVDGFQVIEVLNRKNILKKVPVILMTREATLEARIRGYDLGALDVLEKPLEASLIKRRVEKVIEIYKNQDHLEFVTKEQNKILRQQAEVLKGMSANVLDMLGSIVEFRSFESSSHIRKVKAFVKVIGDFVAEYYKEYKLDAKEVELISSASCMHDVGKIVIPDEILLKPGRLTADEFEVMKSHTTKGCEIIDELAGYQDEMYYRNSYDICRYHHERFDGNGYPEGLKGDSIPISAQIVSIAEAFDALITDRVYKEGVTVEEAYLKIVDGECGVFSPKLLECFKMSKSKLEEIILEYQRKEKA